MHNNTISISAPSDDSLKGQILSIYPTFNERENLISIPKACERYGLHRPTFWRHIRDGRLKSKKIGGTIFLLIDELENKRKLI